MLPSTVHKILTRYKCPPLSFTDPATGVRIKQLRKKVHSYVHDEPGDMVHVDIKKLGRIPDGGGHRAVGRSQGVKNRRNTKPGYWFIHNAVDDCTRLAYSELLTDERKETAAGFWERANAYFNAAGITVERVLTSNSQDLWMGVSRDLLIASRFVGRLVVVSFDEDAVLERRASTDESDEVGCVHGPPPVLGGLDELERHRDPGGTGAWALGDSLTQPDGREGRLDRVRRA